MAFSSMKFYCNACGKECNCKATWAIGRDWKVCSVDCLSEIQWRVTLSLLGKEYKERIE